MLSDTPVFSMLFHKKVKAAPCDQAPCGTGMSYLAPSYKRTASIVERAEAGVPQGAGIGTNAVFGSLGHIVEMEHKVHKFH
mmetsp:Transcript_39242/g.123765  ORF Transcript_39242/g.123765 Transcript_39242/m.123765 type:complete len:81 (+) Transcript_39242:42-284(+)